MDYREAIQTARHEAGQLEALYRQALREQEADSFREGLLESYAGSPENLLYQAWYYRLQAPSPELAAAPKVEGRVAALRRVAAEAAMDKKERKKYREKTATPSIGYRVAKEIEEKTGMETRVTASPYWLASE